MPDIRSFLKRLTGKVAVDQKKNLTMRQVLSVSKTRIFPSWRQWKQLSSVLTNGERKTIQTSLIVILFSGTVLVGSFILTNRVEIPAVGGEYTEGLIGEPQFINPLYASTNDVDQDLASLIYSGLLRWDAQEGFVPDLAESIEINEDGTIYTLKIRDDARFHNGDEILASDVVFTINAIQNANYRSPLAENFFGATIVQDDDKTISFILDEASATFVQNLSVGILPSSLWADVLPQNAPLAALNLQPVGSGPYRFQEFVKDKKGSIRSYTLSRNENYYSGAALIETLTFKFYADSFELSDALENKNVEGVSYVSFENLETATNNKNISLLQPLIPREIVLFFNQEINDVLSDLPVRSAIRNAIDKESLLSELYGDSGRVIHGPILEDMIGYHFGPTTEYDLALANSTLDEAGYELNGKGRDVKESLIEETEEETVEDIILDDGEKEDSENQIETNTKLNFTLTTVNSAEMLKAAEMIQSDLSEVGITIEIVSVPSELFFTEVIEPRNYELLLTALMLEADPDPYPFWHSSQIDSGLNLAAYENDDVDTLLEEARVEIDKEVRAEKYRQFQELLATDVPAVFLYQSPYNYAVASKIQNVTIESILRPSDRFNSIEKWYIKTKKTLR